MKKFLKVIILSLIITATCFMSGCWFIPGLDDESGGGLGDLGDLLFPSGTISGFKVCYKPEIYNFEKVFENYSYSIIDGLYTYFTIGELSKDPPDTPNALKLDRVRNQMKTITKEGTTYLEEISNSSWNWTFGQIDGVKSYAGFDEEYDANSIIEFYNENFDMSIMSKDIITPYTYTLEYAVYEMILGRETSDISVSIDANGYPTITIGEDVITKDTKREDLTNSLLAIQSDFAKYGTYVGFSDRDREKLTTFILEEIIGDKIINDPTYNENNEYQNKVEQLVETDPPVLEGNKNFFDPYPASKIKDFNGSTFFINAGVGENGESTNDAFGHIPYAEYQSFAIMPEKEVEFSTIWLAFVAQTELDAVIRIRYYDANTNTVYEVKHWIQNLGADTIQNSNNYTLYDCVHDLKNII